MINKINLKFGILLLFCFVLFGCINKNTITKFEGTWTKDIYRIQFNENKFLLELLSSNTSYKGTFTFNETELNLNVSQAFLQLDENEEGKWSRFNEKGILTYNFPNNNTLIFISKNDVMGDYILGNWKLKE